MANLGWWRRVKYSVPRDDARAKRALPRVGSIRLGVERLEDRTLLAAGMLDPTFGTNGQVVTEFLAPRNVSARNVVVQGDGRLVVAGAMFSRGAFGIAVARYQATGAPDVTFGNFGQVATQFGGSWVWAGVPGGPVSFGVAVQPDGKIVVVARAGEFDQWDFMVVRYTASGSLDSSFGNGGIVRTDFGSGQDLASDVAVQSDGKIVVGGSGPGGFALARYHSDGILDATFGSGGRVFTRSSSRGTSGGVREITIQPDGRILAMGSVRDEFTNVPKATVVRYQPDGSLDQSFGLEGMVLPPFGVIPNSLSLMADGRIVVAGHTLNSRDPNTAALYRLHSDGRLDGAFGTAGVVTYSLGTIFGLGARDAMVQPDGKIVTVGVETPFIGGTTQLRRYNSDGTLDASFGTAGMVRTLPSDGILRLARLGDGTFVAVGGTGFYHATQPFFLMSFDATGNVNRSFGRDGRVQTEFYLGAVPSAANAVVRQPDGKLVVVGGSPASENSDFLIARYKTDGTLDTGFARQGWVATDFRFDKDVAHGAALQTDGKIVVVGSYQYFGSNATTYALVRCHADGLLDASFAGEVGSDGKARGGSESGPALAIQTDGKIVVAGTTGGDFALLRYDREGRVDGSFPRPARTDFGLGRFDSITAIVIQPDGKIVAVGVTRASGNSSDPADFALARYHPDGTLDTSFGTGGKITAASGTSDLTPSVALQPNGKIVVAGKVRRGADTDFVVLRFNADGSPDTTFGTGGRTATDFGGIDEAKAVAVQRNGRIVLAGSTSSGPNGDWALARYSPDGTLDNTFGVGGKITTDFRGHADAAAGVLVEPDGKIVVVGSYSLDASGTRTGFAVVRYLGGPTLTPNERWVTQVYSDLLERSADPAGLASWTEFLDRGGSRTDLVTRITASPEYRTVVVRGLYRRLLGRDAEPAGLTIWVGFLNQGGTTDQLRALLLGSDEYFRRAGATAGGFLNALYRDTLGRAPDPVALREFSPMVNARIPLTAVVAAAVLRSPESDRLEVQELYRRYLRRDADSTGHDSFTALLQRGVANEVVLAALVGSEEYFRRV